MLPPELDDLTRPGGGKDLRGFVEYFAPYPIVELFACLGQFGAKAVAPKADPESEARLTE